MHGKVGLEWDHPTLAYEVVEEKGWIGLRDGTRLAATFYRPKSEKSFPALLEYLPYRKDDGTVPRDRQVGHYLAKRGYVSVRVDVRGTGSSEGAPAENEYVLQEQLDGCQVIEWLAAQEWCTGKVGMHGRSYGGFNTILVASHNPPHLAAIAPRFFADDGYTDGDHFEGGCLSAMGLGYYGLWMLAMNALPPDPQYFEGKAPVREETWRRRLEEYEPWVLEWFDHQTNDAFWRVQSLRPKYAAIKCPVFMFGGWGDHFRNAVLRMLAHLQVPRKAIIGPWVHMRPNEAFPGPQIDYLYELVRWWDYWLKGIDNGIMDEPSLAIYVQRDRPPGLFADYAEGYWRFEEGWPLADAQEDHRYFQAQGFLSTEAPTDLDNSYDQYLYRPDVGVMGNIWMSQACSLGEEQSLDEAFSLTYTSEPLEKDLEILGFPVVQLYASSSAENTAFVAKLTEVNPEGKSNLVTYGVLNAAHQYSHEKPEALVPGKIYAFRIEMSAISWVFKKGHRIRVSVTSSHWPILWPLPERALNRVYRAKPHASTVSLPVVPPRATLLGPKFKTPHAEEAPTPNVEREPAEPPTIKITRDVIKGETVVEVKRQSGFAVVDRQMTLKDWLKIESRTSTTDPAVSVVQTEGLIQLDYGDGPNISAHGNAVISSSRGQFFLRLSLNVEVNRQPFFEKTWLKTVERTFV